MVRMNIQDWLGLVVVIAVCIYFTRSFYMLLGTYERWKPWWKRSLLVSPIIIALVFHLLIVWYTTTHF
jgi:hypothetical protein